MLGVSSLESAEVEGDLSSVGPEGWHSHPAVMSRGVHMGVQRPRSAYRRITKDVVPGHIVTK